jgi:hypothetical protein
MNEHGKNSLRGKKFSKLLRDIGGEATEICGLDPESGDALFITKAESLARKMWELALGWEQKIEVTDKKTGEVEVKVKRHRPDTAILKELLERIEGKAGSLEKKDRLKPVSQKVAEQTKNRLNAYSSETQYA